MTTAMTITNILLVIAAVALIISVLLQKGSEGGMAALGGTTGAESFLGRNKAKTKQGRLALMTKISAGLFVALALVMVILQ